MSIPEAHKAKAPKKLLFSIIIVSTSRYRAMKSNEKFTDETGNLICKIIKENEHEIFSKRIIPDDEKEIIRALNEETSKNVDVIIFSGGTGLSPKDITIETIEPHLEKKIPGFGELFRMLSYSEIGSSAMMTRCLAGTLQRKAVFCIPGSPNAAELALKKLIIPECTHIIKHVREE